MFLSKLQFCVVLTNILKEKIFQDFFFVYLNGSETLIEDTCDYIELAESSVESIAHVLLVLIDPEAGECINIDYDDIIENERRTEWDAPAVVAGYRQWTFQLCSVRFCHFKFCCIWFLFIVYFLANRLVPYIDLSRSTLWK